MFWTPIAALRFQSATYAEKGSDAMSNSEVTRAVASY
jgi:hypothetical protein